MTNEIRRSRRIDYLGEIGSKLRDLRGTATLAYELIQNAEDAISELVRPSLEQATISFRIDQRALIVDNGGVFSDCRDQDASVCPWKRDRPRPCDFHSFANIGGAAKRRASAEQQANVGLKGAFGFGFIAVYQVTDHPEVISNGRHWILEDQKAENDRILECSRPDCENCSAAELPGTRFVLPWAFDPKSEVRVGLKAPTVSVDKPEELVHELEAALPKTILFLDHVRQLEVFWNQAEKMRVTVTDRSEPVIEVATNGRAVKWAILTHDFEDTAAFLQLQHPEGEKCPSSKVKLAIPEDGSTSGLFFAYLPTQMETGLPFHVNADFFPSTDRKHLNLENDYQGEWNRAAIRAGAIALRKGLLSLRSHLGPVGFWDLIHCVNQRAKDGPGLGDEYWRELLPVLKGQKVIPASSGDWYSVADICFVSTREQEQFHELYAEVGVVAVDPSVESHQELLTSAEVGVKHFDLATFARQLSRNGLSGDRSLEQLPVWFQALRHRELLWHQIGDLLCREFGSAVLDHDHASVRLLAELSLVECNDGHYRTFANCFQADCRTVELFQPLCPELHFAKDRAEMLDSIGELIPKFSATNAIDALASRQAKARELGDEAQGVIPEEKAGEYLVWFSERVGQLEADPPLIDKFKSLAICPTHDGLQPFCNVVLPGGFSDPIGVTSVAKQCSVQLVRPLVQLLQLDSLSLIDYVIGRLPDAFQQWEFEADTCKELLVMLSKKQGELLACDDEVDVRSTLSSLECIPCADGSIRCVDDGVYFATELTKRVLGDSVAYVAESVCSLAITKLLEWLGVESRPRLDRVVDCMIETACSATTPDQQLVSRVLTLFEHLAGRVEELEKNDHLRDQLKTNKWLPSSTRRWDADAQAWRSDDLTWAAPPDVHYHGCRHLVESVASFVGFPSGIQSTHRRLLTSVGVFDRPDAKNVVEHLGKSAALACPVDSRVYDFLDSALQKGELDPADFRSLTTAECLYDPDSKRFFKPSECFSERHPFGTHRVLLDSDGLATRKELLTALGVRPQPTWEDAIEVLRQIAQSDDARRNREMPRGSKSVVTACWKLIENALGDEDASTDSVCSRVDELSKLPVVCRADGIMVRPKGVFFRDREYLAEAFAGSLKFELIQMPQGATDALKCAGVRRLSEVTDIRIRHDNAIKREDTSVACQIRERSELLARVVEACRPARRAASLPDIAKMRVLEVNTLKVDLTFHGFERPFASVTHSVVAVIEQSPLTLWYCLDDGSPPWDAIACELAKMYLDSDDVAQLSAAINAAIEPDSLRRAQRKLNQLGFPSIEVCEEVAAPTRTSPTFGVQGRQLPEELQQSETRDEGSFPVDNASEPTAREPNERRVAEGSVATTANSSSIASNARNAERLHTAAERGREWASTERPTTELRASSTESAALSDDEGRFVDFLKAQLGASDRRKCKTLTASSQADRRSSGYRVRAQRVNQVSREEVLRYLGEFYSQDGRFRCQMMRESDSDLHEMPFWKAAEEMYAGKEELFNGTMTQFLLRPLPEALPLYLFLCPTCAAIYRQFIGEKPDQQLRLLRWVCSETGDSTFSIGCSLSGKQPNRILQFHRKHLDDIRSVDGVFDASEASAEEGR